MKQQDPDMDQNVWAAPRGAAISSVALGICLLLLGTATVTTVSAQELSRQQTVDTLSSSEQPLTLVQAIDIALANNSSIKRALFNVQLADEDVRRAWGEVMPEVTADMSYTRNLELPVIFIPQDFTDPNSPLMAIPAGTDNNWRGGLSANQNIFSGEAFVGISSSKVYKAAQAEQYRSTAQQVVTDTRTAYHDVLIAEENLRLQKQRIERIRQNLEENRKRLEAGLVDEYDVLQLEVQLSNEQPNLVEARFALGKAYRALKLQMGVPVDINIRVQGSLREYDILSETAASAENSTLKKVDRMTPMVIEKQQPLVDKAGELRGDLRVLESQLELKDKQIMATQSRFLPSITASYNLTWQASEPGTPDFFGNDMQRARSQALLLNLQLPLFQGFQRSADLAQVKIERKDLEEQQYFAELAARNEIVSAQEALSKSIETVDAREKALKQARRGYEIARARLQRGVGSQLDVTNAELQFREAELNYASMVYEYLNAKARYDKAVGMVPYVDNEIEDFSN